MASKRFSILDHTWGKHFVVAVDDIPQSVAAEEAILKAQPHFRFKLCLTVEDALDDLEEWHADKGEEDRCGLLLDQNQPYFAKLDQVTELVRSNDLSVNIVPNRHDPQEGHKAGYAQARVLRDIADPNDFRRSMPIGLISGYIEEAVDKEERIQDLRRGDGANGHYPTASFAKSNPRGMQDAEPAAEPTEEIERLTAFMCSNLYNPYAVAADYIVEAWALDEEDVITALGLKGGLQSIGPVFAQGERAITTSERVNLPLNLR